MTDSATGGVRVEGLTVRYGETVAVDDVSLEVKPGELFFLLGPSGCGKTSLLRAVGGLEPAAAGRVLIGGRDVTGLPPYRRGAPMVFQGYALWPHMTLLENTAYGLEAAGVGGAEARRHAMESLKMVGLAERSASRPAELSGGQQQRVALARALAAGPAVILFDEPLSNLDAKLRREMRGELVRLHREAGFTAIYVTHDQEEALSMAERLALMNAGRIVELGEPRALYERPGTRFGAEFLGEVNLLEAEAAGGIIKTELGAAEVKAPADGKHLLGFRPERALLGPGPEGALAWSGKVRESSFLGGTSRIEIELPSGRRLVLCPSGAAGAGAAVGAELSGHVPVEALWLLPAES